MRLLVSNLRGIMYHLGKENWWPRSTQEYYSHGSKGVKGGLISHRVGQFFYLHCYDATDANVYFCTFDLMSNAETVVSAASLHSL